MRVMVEGYLVAVQGQSSQETVSALLRGLRNGSSAAWAALYDEFAPGIQRFATTRLSGDVETAEDVAVETVADAARDIRRFDPQKSSLSAWLYGIARRRVQMEIRRQTRRKSVPTWAQVSIEELGDVPDGRDLASTTSARVDARRRVSEIRPLLSEVETEVLTLSYAEELSEREIGGVVGRSAQAVNSALRRARWKARRTAVEGTLLITGIQPDEGSTSLHSQWVSGTQDWVSGPEIGWGPNLSPRGDEIVYYTFRKDPVTGRPAPSAIWKARRDGSEVINLTEGTGLTGTKCSPAWSPDGSMISFGRCPPSQGPSPCMGGCRLWVMNADGSQAHQVLPEGFPTIWSATWSADGSRILCATGEGNASRLITTDIWGRDIRIAGETWMALTALSPDGSLTASFREVKGEVEGERGEWLQLVLTKADGSHPEVLVQQFISDADAEAGRPPEEELANLSRLNWERHVWRWAGPKNPAWSPEGDKIAFLAAMPFDPRGLPVQLQVEAWIYDLATKHVTRITHDDLCQHSLSWR